MCCACATVAHNTAMKSKVVTIRLKPEEYEWLQRMGHGENYSCVSDWFRRQLLHEAKKRGWETSGYKLTDTQWEHRQGRPTKESMAEKL